MDNKPTWSASYGNAVEITDNDPGYDWSRKDEKIQIGWSNSND